ncbi:hypothetical protein, partial [Acetobacter cibinongensis]
SFDLKIVTLMKPCRFSAVFAYFSFSTSVYGLRGIGFFVGVNACGCMEGPYKKGRPVNWSAFQKH